MITAIVLSIVFGLWGLTIPGLFAQEAEKELRDLLRNREQLESYHARVAEFFLSRLLHE